MGHSTWLILSSSDLGIWGIETSTALTPEGLLGAIGALCDITWKAVSPLWVKGTVIGFEVQSGNVSTREEWVRGAHSQLLKTGCTSLGFLRWDASHCMLEISPVVIR